MTHQEAKIIPFTESDFHRFGQRQRMRIDWRTNKMKGRCVDGRYRRDQMQDAPLATAGGNAGHLGTALAVRNELDLATNRRLFVDALITTLGEDVSSFGMHDLAHALISRHNPHCGHFANILSDPEAYGLTGQDIDFLKRTLIDLYRKGATEHRLEGPHAERAIAVVTNTGIDIIPRSNDAQVFVHHAALEHKFIGNYVRQLIIIHAVPNEQAFIRAMNNMSERHLKTTVTRLPSAKGLSTFHLA